MSHELIDFAAATSAQEISRPLPERVLGGDPVHTLQNLYSEASSQFFAGIWTSNRGRWRVRYTEHEFCVLLEGRLKVESTGDAPKTWTFGPGAAFVVPAGFVGVWEVLEPVRKLYAIFEPGSSVDPGSSDMPAPGSPTS